jgi:hypothetical protein
VVGVALGVAMGVVGGAKGVVGVAMGVSMVGFAASPAGFSLDFASSISISESLSTCKESASQGACLTLKKKKALRRGLLLQSTVEAILHHDYHDHLIFFGTLF